MTIVLVLQAVMLLGASCALLGIAMWVSGMRWGPEIGIALAVVWFFILGSTQ